MDSTKGPQNQPSQADFMEAAQHMLDLYRNPGVTTAIAHVFFHPEGIMDCESQEYKQVSQAYWQLPTTMIPEHLRDQNHALCSGHKCRQCRDRALQLPQRDESGWDRNQAEERLNTLIAAAYAHNGRTACSHDFCVIDACQLQKSNANEEAIFSQKSIQAITYAANNPHLFVDDTDTYNKIMDLFQDQIPHHLIDCNQWWFGHYWSSGHTCSKCREIARLFPCDEPVTDQHFQAMTQRMASGHDPSCSARNVHSFSGLKVCVARMNPPDPARNPSKQTGSTS